MKAELIHLKVEFPCEREYADRSDEVEVAAS